VSNPQAKLCLNSMLDNSAYYAKSFKCSKGVTFVGPRKKYVFDESERRKVLLFLYILQSDIKEVWLYKTMLLHGKKIAAQNSSKNLKISNCVVTIHDSLSIVRQLFLVVLTDDTIRAICFASNVSTTTTTTTKWIYKVANVSEAIRVSACESIDKVKFITLFDASGQMTHACRLANGIEME